MCERIRWLDGWRGLLCCLMVLYHFLYDLTAFGWVTPKLLQSLPFLLLQKLGAMSFIFIAGASSCFSHSNLRRGLVTAGAAAVVVAAAQLVGEPIRYGMLEFLASGMIVYHFIGSTVQRIPGKAAIWLWGSLYLVCWVISSTVTVESKWLYWLGLRYHGFVSTDWVPFFPYIFLFFLGAQFGKFLLRRPANSRWRTMGAPQFLQDVGHRTLLIYMLHQPILYGGCLLVSRFLPA